MKENIFFFNLYHNLKERKVGTKAPVVKVQVAESGRYVEHQDGTFERKMHDGSESVDLGDHKCDQWCVIDGAVCLRRGKEAFTLDTQGVEIPCTYPGEAFAM